MLKQEPHIAKLCLQKLSSTSFVSINLMLSCSVQHFTSKGIRRDSVIPPARAFQAVSIMPRGQLSTDLQKHIDLLQYPLASDTASAGVRGVQEVTRRPGFAPLLLHTPSQQLFDAHHIGTMTSVHLKHIRPRPKPNVPASWPFGLPQSSLRRPVI